MVIGIPKERKVQEYRVAATPQTIRILVQRGHLALVEKDAGTGSGISNEEFKKAGAKIAESEEEVFRKSKLIVKVKELLPEEFPLIRRDQILFSYLHLAANMELTRVLEKNGVKAIAFETVELSDGSLPLLVPMSMIAGRL